MHENHNGEELTADDLNSSHRQEIPYRATGGRLRYVDKVVGRNDADFEIVLNEPDGSRHPSDRFDFMQATH